MTQRDQPARSGGSRPFLSFRRDSIPWVILRGLGKKILEACRDLLPICLVIAVFQGLVLRQPLPDFSGLLAGLGLGILGLALFVLGLEQGLFPIGEAMALAFARKGSLFWLTAFAFGLGFSTTVAEPALLAVCNEAGKVAAGAGVIPPDAGAISAYSLHLRLVVALSVGLAIVLGVIRLLKGWPLPYFILGGYVLVMLLTLVAPPEIIGIAFDSGGVTTSTITVPLVTALGVGLAASIRGRNPLVDGFGMIALASLTPIVFVLAYGILRQ